jgi:molybdopterin synthase sulfur carrier subunit
MRVTIRYFAAIREHIGLSTEEVQTTAADLNALRSELMARGDPYAVALEDGKAIRMALNQQVCDGNTPLMPDAEVAFFPPVTGG